MTSLDSEVKHEDPEATAHHAETLAEHEGKHSADWKGSKVRWPGAVWVEKEILLGRWSPAEVLLAPAYPLSRVQRSLSQGEEVRGLDQLKAHPQLY